MGLDMYLRGIKEYENSPKEDGYYVESKALELGYWRAYRNLHDYIAGAWGDDLVLEPVFYMELNDDQITDIIAQIESGELPYYFTGEVNTDKELTLRAIEIFKKALTWYRTPEKNVTKTICYKASY